MIHLELQEGAKAMQVKEFVQEFKSQAACNICLAEERKACGQYEIGEAGTANKIIGDSWYSSVAVASELQKRGLKYGGS